MNGSACNLALDVGVEVIDPPRQGPGPHLHSGTVHIRGPGVAALVSAVQTNFAAQLASESHGSPAPFFSAHCARLEQ
jgi:hypothetical protein